MATTAAYEKLTTRERQSRYFSETFKRKKVSEIERNLSRVSEVCREYQVSETAVYRWIHKFGRMNKQGLRQVVEAKSDTRKLLLLKEQLREMERIIGQKQLKIDFLEKQIELAEEEYGVDIKKKFTSGRSAGIGSTGKSKGSK